MTMPAFAPPDSPCDCSCDLCMLSWEAAVPRLPPVSAAHPGCEGASAPMGGVGCMSLSSFDTVCCTVQHHHQRIDPVCQQPQVISSVSIR